jgi:hypothetical protein
MVGAQAITVRRKMNLGVGAYNPGPSSYKYFISTNACTVYVKKQIDSPESEPSRAVSHTLRGPHFKKYTR